MGSSSHGPLMSVQVAVGILTHREERVLVRDERRNALKMCVVFALGAIARPIRPLTGLRLWMGRLLGGLFSHAGGTDALRKARQRSRTVGGPMEPVLYRRSGHMGHKRRMMPDYYPSPLLVTIHHPCVLSGTRASERNGSNRQGTGAISTIAR